MLFGFNFNLLFIILSHLQENACDIHMKVKNSSDSQDNTLIDKKFF